MALSGTPDAGENIGPILDVLAIETALSSGFRVSEGKMRIPPKS